MPEAKIGDVSRSRLEPEPAIDMRGFCEKAPMISIIVPAYNVERYIEKCINSVLKQTYKEWELIIVDDGSMDKTGVIADGFAAENDNITVIHQTNHGVSYARNRGIDLAHGLYFLFLDADDWIEENMLETMMYNGQQADLIVCGINDCFQENNGSLSIKPRKIWEKQDCFISDDVFFDVFCKTGTLSNKLFHVNSIGSIRFSTKMTYGEDAFFLAQALSNVNRAVIVPRHMYYYVKNRNGNVVSAKIDSRSLQFLDNTLETYFFLKSIGKSVYGVNRMETAVREVMSKIEDLDDSSCQCYIRKCGNVLRKVKFKDQLAYILDPRFKRSIKGKFFFVLLICCPKLAIKKRRTNSG